MRKIFYDKKTLEIKGMSDGCNPFSKYKNYIILDKPYHSTENLKLVRNPKTGKVEVEIKETKLQIPDNIKGS